MFCCFIELPELVDVFNTSGMAGAAAGNTGGAECFGRPVSVDQLLQ